MVNVGIVRMRMSQLLVPMGMGVRLTWRVTRRVRMLVVFVVGMQMFMLHRLVGV